MMNPSCGGTFGFRLVHDFENPDTSKAPCGYGIQPRPRLGAGQSLEECHQRGLCRMAPVRGQTVWVCHGHPGQTQLPQLAESWNRWESLALLQN